jgi:hypothetical protein
MLVKTTNLVLQLQLVIWLEASTKGTARLQLVRTRGKTARVHLPLPSERLRDTLLLNLQTLQ